MVDSHRRGKFRYARGMRENLARRSVALILAGGRGTRLRHLTEIRAKPAVYFGGKYRIIDFVLSNCVNSGIRRIYVATQYKSHSLLRHIQRGWGILRGEVNEFIDLVPAQQRVGGEWYQGTADAVWQNVDILRDEAPEYVLILAGDHIYRQDYGVMLEHHIESGAAATVGCVKVPRAEASAFGVMDVDADGCVIGFQEKPADPPGLPDDPEHTLASMGIYVFSAQRMYDELARDADTASSSHDFGKDLIPHLVDSGAKVLAHALTSSAIYSAGQETPYWRDVGNIDAYWEANIDLCAVTPQLDLYDERWPIWTYQLQLPPAKLVFDDDQRRGSAVDSVISAGSVISGATVRRSVLSTQVRVSSYARVEDCVVLPRVHVGRHARLRKVVVDRGCVVPEGLVVGDDPDLDAKRFYRTQQGVTVITQSMLDAL